MLQDNALLEAINSDDYSQTQRYVNDLNLIKYLDDRLFRKYEPAKSPCLDFISRMRLWIDNVESKEHKIALYNLVSKIFFVGEEEFNSLYRVAFHEVVIPWIVTKEGFTVTDKEFSSCLEDALSKTWFCPISDSLRINAFYHVNHIIGRDFRPDWRSLKRFADISKIEEFIESSKIKRIVLLEDFVGSGGQALGIIDFLREIKADVEILLAPLIICPKGNEKIMGSLGEDKNIEYQPVVKIPESEMVSIESSATEHDFFNALREINAEHAHDMDVKYIVDDNERVNIGTFGYRNTGALVVMYSNCPNNTMSVVHRSKPNWSPLFPRSERYGS